MGHPADLLDHLIVRLRTPHLAQDLTAHISHDVVLTHDGSQLFAYAADLSILTAARRNIEAMLRSDGLSPMIYVSRWDDRVDDWRQVDPPLMADDEKRQMTADRSAKTAETRTLVASAGKLIQPGFEQSMLDWSTKLGLECTVFEHPHLLTTQVGFTLTGPRRKIDEFAQGLTARTQATIRGDAAVLFAAL